MEGVLHQALHHLAERLAHRAHPGAWIDVDDERHGRVTRVELLPDLLDQGSHDDLLDRLVGRGLPESRALREALDEAQLVLDLLEGPRERGDPLPADAVADLAEARAHHAHRAVEQMRERQLQLPLHLAPDLLVELGDAALSHVRGDLGGDERQEQEHERRELISKQDLGVAGAHLASDLPSDVVVAQQGVLELDLVWIEPCQQRVQRASRPVEHLGHREPSRSTQPHGELRESNVFEVSRRRSLPFHPRRRECSFLKLQGIHIGHDDGSDPCIDRCRSVRKLDALHRGHDALQVWQCIR
ncbi:hypothetical protein [Sorangium cellulosum]|uniref:hypothetical protein n=1 Tax=Sorangium cellulosum TaxID=56 RepID=UPI001F5D81FB|nr:hypothetical protein [Sorangium cellulosum]